MAKSWGVFETTGECVDESGVVGDGIAMRAAIDGGCAAGCAKGAESSAGFDDDGWAGIYKWCAGALRLDYFSGRYAEDERYGFGGVFNKRERVAQDSF